MHLRIFARALTALSAVSLSHAQEGSTPPPKPSTSVATQGEPKAPASVQGNSQARIAPTGIVENLPIPSVRPEFDLTRRGVPGREPGTERWNVTFYQRGFDLTEFRNAIYGGAPVAEVNAIVAGLERKMIADQAAFAAWIVGLGGRVSHQWWIINGCAVEVPRHVLVLIAAIPNVATLDPDLYMEPVIDPKVPTYGMILTSTNASNHDADSVQAKGYRGAGVGIAIVDTGQDSNMGGTGVAHRTYFLDGIKPGTNLLAANFQLGSQAADDTHGHGTGVCSIASGNDWGTAAADHGHAPHARKVGYSICDVAGSCTTSLAIEASAFNKVAADKATYNIVSANMSYGSSPSPTDVSQQAIDSCARNANVLIAVSAGNNGASTAGSASVANGLAVAACNATTKTMATFSSRGPLSGDAARFYPDITACGVSTVMALRNNEAGNYTDSGTSMASPQVCGAAGLIRSVDTTLTALETKAILLCTTESIAAQNPTAPYNSRNAYGMGFLRDDLAIDQTLSETSAFTATIADNTVRTFPMRVTSGRSYSVVLTWHRSVFASTVWNNLNLRVLNGAAVVAASADTRNLYEKAVFTSPITGTLTIEVSEASTPLNPNPETFAICHNGDPECIILPEAMNVTMGNSNNAIPFSWTPTRYQQVFLGSEIGPSENLQNLRLRQDDGFNSNTGALVDVEIKLGYTTLNHTNMTTTFASNITGTSVCVVPRMNIVLPNFPPANNTDPKAFLVVIPFAAPFPWVPAANRNLVVDVTQRGNSRGSAIFSYPLDAHGGTGVTTTRVYGTDTSLTGTVGANYGLVMCLGTTAVGVAASYGFYGTGCPGTGPGTAHVIVPAAQAAAMGNTANAIPLSWTPVKYQQVFLGAEQPVARVYNGLGLRQDNALHASIGGVGVDLEMQLGYTTLTNATLGTTFATNYNTGAPTTVLARQVVRMPNVPAVANLNPAEFFIQIPFTTPFGYVPAAGRNTLIQVIQRGNTACDDNFNYYLDADPATTTTRLYGFPDTALTGTLSVNYGLVMSFIYAGPGGAIPLLTNTGDPVIGNTFSVNVSQARPNSIAILLHGISNTSWGFLALPFHLNGIGAPGCFLRAQGIFLLAAGTNAFGRGSVSFTIPGDLSVLGGPFFDQFAVSDPGANALGFSWTRGGVGIMGNK